LRLTGMGWSIGIGRLGAILAPVIAGVLLDSGWSPPNLYYAFAIPLVAAMITVLAIKQGSGAVRNVPGAIAQVH